MFINKTVIHKNEIRTTMLSYLIQINENKYKNVVMTVNMKMPTIKNVMQIDPTGHEEIPIDGNCTYRINFAFKKAAKAVGGHYTSLQAPPESLSASPNNDNNANATVCVTVTCESPNQCY